MAPLKPTWTQPSHPNVQEVQIKLGDYATRSVSKVDLRPFEVLADLNFPPCTKASVATYATVQMGQHEHLSLNSDLVYINHSCEPSLIFDTGNMKVIAGPKGLKKGDELTFFYPSTEYTMAQCFECICSTLSCRGFISGAEKVKAVNPSKLSDSTALWLNKHIAELLDIPGEYPPWEALAQAKALWALAHVDAVGSRAISGEMGGDTNGNAK
ncbi:hypothetical protein BJ878DRAFT_4954 [Calycina marina]|uniref:Post-SET domain-containing protein n=1 Tax=Calycina marina TaxID=1763456 RepID=A0A9P8CIS4_9HELO|nr:hypothetical protein BJ878DRAFT_4954 [Calycina marina]